MAQTYVIEDDEKRGVVIGKCKLCPYSLELSYRVRNKKFEDAYQEMIQKFNIHAKNDHQANEEGGDKVPNKEDKKPEDVDPEYEEIDNEATSTQTPKQKDEFNERIITERPKTPQEMMLEEMVQLLSDLLSKAPGASNVAWIVEQFKRNPLYQQDAHELFNLIHKHAPKMLDEDAESIVNAVMAVKRQYIKDTSYRPRFDTYDEPRQDMRFTQPPTPFRQSLNIPRQPTPFNQPIPQGPIDYNTVIQLVTDILNKEREEMRREREKEELQRRFEDLQRQQLEMQKNMMEQITKMQQSFQQELLRLQAEKSKNVDDDTRKELQELRRQQMEQLRETYQRELDRMNQILKDQQAQLEALVEELNDAYKERQTSDYKTDDARLLSDSIKTAAETAKSLAEENKKTRLELAKLAGKMFMQGIGGEEVTEEELTAMRQKQKSVNISNELENVLNQITDKE